MKFVNIMGPVHDLDRAVEEYLTKYEIQLEYTIKELSNEKELVPFSDPNPYMPMLKKAERLATRTHISDEPSVVGNVVKIDISKKKAIETLEYATAYFDKAFDDLNGLVEKKEQIGEVIKKLEPYKTLAFPVEKLVKFSFIKCRFGKMPMSSYKQFETFLYDEPEILFIESGREDNYIWGIYFATSVKCDKADSMFSSLHFERLTLPEEVCGEPLVGIPSDLIETLSAKYTALDADILEKEKLMLNKAYDDENINMDRYEIIAAYNKIVSLSHCFDVRKYAAQTPNFFYIFVGWMTQKDAAALKHELTDDGRTIFIIEDDNESIASKPPTKLKNPLVFKPFEFFVKMYGLPAYDEIDPTPFVALTYTILFGIMFADVGQGLFFSLLGWFLFAKKGMQIGKIMCTIGFSSAFFGILFGSVFGYEFSPLWLHPADPANINFIITYAAGFGVFLILVSIAFNLANAVRKKKLKQAFFDPNGILGLIFYVSALAVALLVLTGNSRNAIWLVIFFIIIPLFFIAFRQPVLNLINGKKKLIHGNILLFLFETSVEAFEVILGYFSNTVSFVRVGAFALSHASMMSVVMMLSQTSTGANNIFIVILGNLIVMALEGLVVGIQVLRLQFYEMFSRFYKGSGRPFEPYAITKH